MRTILVMPTTIIFIENYQSLERRDFQILQKGGKEGDNIRTVNSDREESVGEG